MSDGLTGPGPAQRTHPDGKRTEKGSRMDGPDDEETSRVVLSAYVKNEPGVTAKLTGLFARRQINIERIVGEPVDEDGTHSRITFVVEPPHPGVEQISKQVEKLLPVLSVDKYPLETADRITASIDES